MRKTANIGLLVFVLTGVRLGADPAPHAVKWALGQIETGAAQATRSSADTVRGKKAEISRYQILPRVWREYSDSRDYSNPDRAWEVAQRILRERTDRFRRMAGREPQAFDLYVMWNAPGHYEGIGFNRARVRKVVAKRAERFSALVADHPSPINSAGEPIQRQ